MSEKHRPVTDEELAHAFEDDGGPPDLSDYAVEDWVTMIVFWGMALCVFLQFFTRYVLNNSFAWTEEIAINCLVVVVFLGSVWCVRQSRHIQVDVLYHYIPHAAARVLATLVDLIRIAFFGYWVFLLWRYIGRVRHDEMMVTIAIPKAIIYYTVFAAFVLMLLRSLQVAWRNVRRGHSALEDSGTATATGD